MGNEVLLEKIESHFFVLCIIIFVFNGKECITRWEKGKWWWLLTKKSFARILYERFCTDNGTVSSYPLSVPFSYLRLHYEYE